jgi:choline transport protein
VGIVGTLAIGISEGGTILLLYGIIIMLIFGGCCATTLAELSSVYPTAGGQYHWTSILSPKKYSRVLVKTPARELGSFFTKILQSYCCGAINIFSWISITAGVTILPAQFIISMAIYNNPGYEAKSWHYFLIYQATNIIILLYNIFAIRKTSWVHDIGCKYPIENNT